MKFIPIIPVGFLITLAACGPSAPTDTAHAGHDDHEAGPATEIRLTTAQVARAGVEVGAIEQRPLAGEITASAEAIVGPEYQARVSALTDGVVTRLGVGLNSAVQRGAVVAVVRKPDLLDVQQQYLEGRDRLAFLEGEYERYRGLREADATANKNFTRAEAELRAARTTHEVLAAKLRQYGIDPAKLTPANLRTEIVLTAPISGTVTHLDASVGTALTPGAAVCEIVDFSRLQPVLYVFEKDLARVQPGQAVALSRPADAGTEYRAKIVRLERTVDSERRAVRVHAAFVGPAPSSVAAGSFLDARITAGSTANVPALPKDAVVREGQENFIFIEEKADDTGRTYRKIAVQTGGSDATHIAITPAEPLPAEARVVVKGAYYISAQGTGVADEH